MLVNVARRRRRASSARLPAGAAAYELGTNGDYVKWRSATAASGSRGARARSGGAPRGRRRLRRRDGARAAGARDAAAGLATRDAHTFLHGHRERRGAPARRVHLRRLAQGLLPLEPQRTRSEDDGASTRTCRSAPGVNVVTRRRAREPGHGDAPHVLRPPRRPERRAPHDAEDRRRAQREQRGGRRRLSSKITRRTREIEAHGLGKAVLHSQRAIPN